MYEPQSASLTGLADFLLRLRNLHSLGVIKGAKPSTMYAIRWPQEVKLQSFDAAQLSFIILYDMKKSES